MASSSSSSQGSGSSSQSTGLSSRSGGPMRRNKISSFLVPGVLEAFFEKNPAAKDGTMWLVPGMNISKHYKVRKGDPSIDTKYMHRILFKDDCFTCDEKLYRRVTDPANASFLKSLKEGGCPDEFKEDGVHCISIVRKPEKMALEFPKGKINYDNCR